MNSLNKTIIVCDSTNPDGQVYRYANLYNDEDFFLQKEFINFILSPLFIKNFDGKFLLLCKRTSVYFLTYIICFLCSSTLVANAQPRSLGQTPAVIVEASQRSTENTSVRLTVRANCGLKIKSQPSVQGKRGFSKTYKPLKSSEILTQAQHKHRVEWNITDADFQYADVIQKLEPICLNPDKVFARQFNLVRRATEKWANENRIVDFSNLTEELVSEFQLFVENFLNENFPPFAQLVPAPRLGISALQIREAEEIKERHIRCITAWQLTPSTRIPSFDRAINYVNIYLNKAGRGLLTRTELTEHRIEARRLFDQVTVQELPLLNFVHEEERPRLAFYYFIKQASFNMIATGDILCFLYQNAHLWAASVGGLKLDFNLVTISNWDHALGTEIEFLMSPTTAPRGGGLQLYKTAANTQSQCIISRTAGNRALERAFYINNTLGPLESQASAIKWTSKNAFTRGKKLLKKAMDLDSKDPVFVKRNCELIDSVAFKLGQQVGRGYFFLALQTVPDQNFQSTAAVYGLGAELWGFKMAQTMVEIYRKTNGF